MKTLIFYATRHGNTFQVANAIADALRPAGPVDVISVEAGVRAITDDVDLILVGGPTEGHGMTPQVEAFLDGMPALDGRNAAAFDTRLNWPRWASGSAAAGIRGRLEESGARRPIPSASFIVSMTPEIEPGELQRAAAWATDLADTVQSIPAIALVGGRR
jgi:flavodoxin